MPYTVVMTDDQHCVHKQDSDGNPIGESLGCHDTHDAAVEQIAAIEASEQRGKSIGLKSLGDGRVGGYLVRYGSAVEKDLQGEYFTRETNYGLDWYKTRPALYHHGLDGKIKSSAIGIIDSLQADDVGLWAEAQLDMHNEYAQAVLKLIEKGALSWSSGSLPHLVDVDKTGRIKAWPIVEGSLTPTPAEPRRETQIQSLKHLVLDEHLLAELPAKEATPSKVDDNETPNQSVNTSAHKAQQTSEDNMHKALSEEQRAALMEKVAPMVAEMIAAVEAELGAPVEEEAQEVIVEGAVAVIEETIPDDMADKAEDDMEDEESPAAKWLAANLETAVDKAFENYAKRQQNRQQRAKSLADSMKQHIRPVSKKSQVGGYRDGNAPGQLHYSIDEERRYAHMTSDHMALGVKIAAAAAYPHGSPKGATLQHIGLDESYGRVMAQKMMDDMPDAPRIKGQDDHTAIADYYAIKSVFNGVKANELDAVANTGQGLEWAVTWYDSRLMERARADTQLFDLMVSGGMRTATVTGNTMNVKLPTGSSTVYTIPEARSLNQNLTPETTIKPTPITTAEIEENVQYHALATPFTDQLTQQSIVDIAAYVDSDGVRTMTEALEDGLINGDKTATSANINTDNTPGTGVNTPLYIWADGIRHNWLVEYPAVAGAPQRRDAGGSLTALDYLRTIELFPYEIQARPGNLLFVVDPGTKNATRGLPEVLTVAAAGENRNTIFAGPIPDLFEVALYTSTWARKSQADGTISDTAASNTVGSINCVYCEYWQYGRQQDISIELERYPGSKTTVVYMSIGHVFKARGAFAAVGTRNVGLSS